MKTFVLVSTMLLASLTGCQTLDCMSKSEPLKTAANVLVDDVSKAALDVPAAKVLVDKIRADAKAQDYEHLAVDAFALGQLLQNNQAVYTDCRNFLLVVNQVRIECRTASGKVSLGGDSDALLLPPRN